ncbi:ribonucleoprotein [Candidatus Bathyarchaeota archaeon]|nr:ribonucleoprotein [Candidatus Bathyarchaeota archaeon]
MESPKRPLNVLMHSLNGNVTVKLKNNDEYRGKMVRCDNYMNIILEEATEVSNSSVVANYGSIFIRGNNVLYICTNPQ